MTTKKTLSEVDKTTYLLETKSGQQRKVTVPAGWRVTFGPTVPFARKEGRSYGDELWALRFYADKDLKAIFTDVKSFREMSEISVSEKRVKTQRQSFSKDGKKGGKAVIAEARIEEWVDPDDPEADTTPSEFLKLGFDSEKDIEVEEVEF